MAATFYFLFPVACADPGFWVPGYSLPGPNYFGREARYAAGTGASPGKPIPSQEWV